MIVTVDEAKIDALIAERHEARAAKDYDKADAIRDWLWERGVVLEDYKTETWWRAR